MIYKIRIEKLDNPYKIIEAENQIEALRIFDNHLKTKGNEPFIRENIMNPEDEISIKVVAREVLK